MTTSQSSGEVLEALNLVVIDEPQADLNDADLIGASFLEMSMGVIAPNEALSVIQNPQAVAWLKYKDDYFFLATRVAPSLEDSVVYLVIGGNYQNEPKITSAYRINVEAGSDIEMAASPLLLFSSFLTSYGTYFTFNDKEHLWLPVVRLDSKTHARDLSRILHLEGNEGWLFNCFLKRDDQGRLLVMWPFALDGQRYFNDLEDSRELEFYDDSDFDF